MAKPDPRQGGLDPGHILAICNRVAGDGGHEPVGFLLAAPDGVRVGVRSRRAARQMRAELTHIGYRVQVIRPRRRWRLQVTGWSGQALERRLAAMRATIFQLRGTQAATAAIVISQYRNLVLSVPAEQANSAALASAERQLRQTVEGACGVFAPRDPAAAVLPADRGDALRLRTIWALEQLTDALIEHHMRAARLALAEFRALHRHASDDWAAGAAVRRRAGLPSLRGQLANGGAPGGGPPSFRSGTETARPAAARDVSNAGPRPGRQARLDFPASASEAIASAARPTPTVGSPPVRPAEDRIDLTRSRRSSYGR